MWGVIPAAGRGTRIQPLGFSKELLPIGCGGGAPRAAAEYLVDRMLVAGADKLCLTIAPDKADILAYFGSRCGSADLCYAVQPEPRGLCDAIFRAAPFVTSDEPVLIGLPDTIWYPRDGFSRLPDDALSLLVFEVEEPEHFDAVCTDGAGAVVEVQVKHAVPSSRWVWGAMKMPGRILRELGELWRRPERGDEYLGTLFNAYLAAGGRALAAPAGGPFIDVGTPAGYERALRDSDESRAPARPRPACAHRGRSTRRMRG